MSRPILAKLTHPEELRAIMLKGHSEVLQLRDVSHIHVSDSSIYLKHIVEGAGARYAVVTRSEIVWMNIITKKLSTHYEEV